MITRYGSNTAKMSDEPLHSYDGLDIGAWANQDPKGVARGLVAAANQGDPLALRWVRRLVKHRVTDSLLADVDRIVRGELWSAFLILEPSSRKFEWRLRPRRDSLQDREKMFGWMVAWLVTVDAIDGLKRCALKDCRKYFVGGPRAKWCSENCGSKYRIRKKRKLDRERQML